MKSSMTIKKLAKILGYSPSTISKALNDSHEISIATKKKIKKAANRHSYEPNFHASCLRSKKSLILGVILPDLKDTFFLCVLCGFLFHSRKEY